MAKIRFSVLIIACFIASSSSAGLSLRPHKSAIQARLLTSGVECLKDHPLTKEQITEFRAKKLPDEDGAKCFAACLFKEFGIIDGNGIVSVTGAKKSAGRVFKNEQEYVIKVGEIVETCAEVNERAIKEDAADESCERAKLVFDCLVENGPKLGFDLKF